MSKRSRFVLAAVVVAVCAPSGLKAANRFFINNASMPVGSASQTVSVLADIDQPIYGFSIHMTFDATKMRVTGVQAGSAVAALAPEYNDGTFTNSPGRVVWGVVLDLSNPITKNLSAGTNKEILKVTMDVLSVAATTVLLDLVNNPGNPSRLNVMTNSNGDSVVPSPTLADGTLTITGLTPTIQSITPSNGPVGTDVEIVGQNFNQAGLAVTICGKPAAFTLLPDNQTISASTPDCAPGAAEVKVCTNFGCDTEAAGFTYSAGPKPPVIDSILNNSGTAGKGFLITGQNFDTGGLAVQVCNVDATFTLLADNASIQVTAPACATAGCAVVKVTTVNGSDSDPCGFTYQGAGALFIRGNANGDRQVDLSDAVFVLNYLFAGGGTPTCLDAADSNDTGTVDLSDPIFMLNYLFQGGQTIKPPYPAAGTDPTPDGLPAC